MPCNELMGLHMGKIHSLNDLLGKREVMSAKDWSKPSVSRDLGWNVPLRAFFERIALPHLSQLFPADKLVWTDLSYPGPALPSLLSPCGCTSCLQWCSWSMTPPKMGEAQWLESAPLQLGFTSAVTGSQEKGNWIPWMYNVPLRKQLWGEKGTMGIVTSQSIMISAIYKREQRMKEQVSFHLFW